MFSLNLSFSVKRQCVYQPLSSCYLKGMVHIYSSPEKNCWYPFTFFTQTLYLRSTYQELKFQSIQNANQYVAQVLITYFSSSSSLLLFVVRPNYLFLRFVFQLCYDMLCNKTNRHVRNINFPTFRFIANFLS